MRTMTLVLLGLSLASSGLLAGSIIGQDSSRSDASQVDPNRAQEDAWQQYAAPGKEQAWLAKLAGRWNVASREWTGPDEPPHSSTMTSQMDMILGGRFRYEYLSGTRLGRPFEGSSVTGFNNVTEEFVLSWVDNFGTGISQGTGARAKDDKGLDWTWTVVDPVSMKPMKVRGVQRIQSEDRFTFEIFSPTSDGGEFKVLELTYTRAG